jgi:ATP-dependent DNA helicase PIF1
MSDFIKENKVLWTAALMGQNILMHGPGGTGKTNAIRTLAQKLKDRGKEVYCTATTGIAALNMGEGMALRTRTLHSWAGIGLGKDDKDKLLAKVASKKKSRDRWQKTNILIVDEVSMLGKDLFEKLDYIGRRIRKCEILPFGGIQLILSGDFLQLPPIKDDFPFESAVWNRCAFVIVPFLMRRRFDDVQYFDLLLRVRKGEHTQEDLRILQSCVKKYDDMNKKILENGKKRRKLDDEPEIKPTILHSKVIDVSSHNSTELDKLPGDVQIYFAVDNYTPIGPHSSAAEPFYEHMLEETIPAAIQLKPGAQVMLRANLDLEGGLVNGSRGVILACNSDSVDVKFKNDKRVRLVPHTWEFQDESMIASRTQIPLLLAWSITIHKCVSRDSMIYTVDNGMRLIGDIADSVRKQEGWEPLELSLHTKNGTGTTSQIYVGTEEDTLIIKTRLGYKLEGSLIHPVLTINSNELTPVWKTLPQLKIGDSVVLRHSMNSSSNELVRVTFKPDFNFKNKYNIPTHINENISYMIGLLIGDSCYSSSDNDYAIEFVNTDQDLIAKFEDIFLETFGVPPKKYKKGKVDGHKDATNIMVCSKLVRKFFEWCGLDYVTARNKKIPWTILQNTLACQKKCLKGLFDTDGGINATVIHFTSTSAELCQQIQNMLINYGIISRIYHFKKTNAWRVELCGNDARKYMKEIGFYCKGKSDEGMKRYGTDINNTKSNIGEIPNGIALITKLKSEIYSKYNLLEKDLSKFFDQSKKDNFIDTRLSDLISDVIKGVNKFRCSELQCVIDWLPNINEFETGKIILEMKQNNWFFDEINEIVESKAIVCDFEVPETNSFIANGFVSHNCQGCTLDYAICNLGQSVFADGQAYVALSRVRNLNGLYITNFYPKCIKASKKALAFENTIPITHQPKTTEQSNQNNNVDEVNGNDLDYEDYKDYEDHEDYENNTIPYKNYSDNKKIENDDSCVVCLANTKNIAFIPCGHICSCEVCYKNINQCPICRSEINSIVKVYIV